MKRLHSLSPSLSLLLLFCFTSLSRIFAQETPAYETPAFDTNQTFRQNVCERQEMLHNGTVKLRDALAGLALRPRVGGDIRRDPETGAIQEDYPGIVGVILDELARRAAFTWRNSYGVTTTPGRGNQTFDDLLDWSVDTYDFMAAGWTETIERMNRGVVFPEGWRDGSIIMVGIESANDSKLHVWSFLQPFDKGLWIMIAVTILVSGLVYYVLEHFNQQSDLQYLTRPTESIYLAALSFTQQSNFQPRTDYARLFAWSLMFWALLVTSAYTANLASFLVVENTPSVNINSIGDAVRLNYPLCVWSTTAEDTIVSGAYPQAKIVRKTEYVDIYNGIRQADCRFAITAVSDWESYEQRSQVNGDCRLNWIGRVFKFVQTGFATKSDSGTLCTSLIRDVLDLHLKEMKEDGFLAREWSEFLNKEADTNCDVQEADRSSEDDDSIRLSLQDMAGLFILHFALTAIAVCMFIYATFFDKKKCRFVWKQEAKTTEEVAKGNPITVNSGSGSNDCVNEKVIADENVTVDQKANVKLLELRKQMRDWLAVLDEQVQDETGGKVVGVYR
jgi:hypothetical protein